MRIPKVSSLIVAVVITCLSSISVQAGVKRIEISSRSDFLGGKSFGLVGAYEKIVGKVYFSVDPKNPHNQVIVDLDKAPRNAQGEVEFSADLYILKPKDLNRGNGAALVEIPNRGMKLMVALFNRTAISRRDLSSLTDIADAGDGFLMRQGFTLVWVGWQYDVPAEGFLGLKGLMRLDAPVATEDGKEITGAVRSDFVFDTKTYYSSLGHAGLPGRPALDPESQEYTLTVRDTVLGPRQTIPRNQWQFARVVDGRATPDPGYIYLKGGFEPGRIYEVVYRSKDPAVAGLGLAAARDLVSYLKYHPGGVVSVHRAYGFGASESGRFLRHFLYQGFNEDESDRQVFDGIDIHVAGAGRGSFNHRFAEPSRDGMAFRTFFYPTDIFPFTDIEQTDPETGETAGLLSHYRNPKVLPKIFYTFTSYEYWHRAASLTHTTIDGKADAPLMENVRIYYFPGAEHDLGFSFPPAKKTARDITLTQQPVSPNDYRWSLRALLLDMDQWVREGTAPPPSQYPRIADGALVRPQDVRFPKIPGVELPQHLHEAYRIYYGPQFKQGVISNEPPIIGKAFPVMVPQVDSDGIDLAGIRMPEVAVPLATYTGWNFRDPRIGAPTELFTGAGSYLPFPRTRAERERANDPRRSIEERYQNRDRFIGMVAEAALKLIRDRYLLAEDLPDILDRAREYWDYAMR